MDFPSLGINWDLNDLVAAIRTLRDAEQAVLKFGDASDRTADRVEASTRRISAANRERASETERSNRVTGRTVEERQYAAAVGALSGRMAFQRRMSAQRLAEERREAAESIATDRAIGTAAQQTTQFRMRLARQRAQEEMAAERAAAAEASRLAQQAAADAQRVATFRSRMAYQRAREESAAAAAVARAEAQASKEAEAASRRAAVEQERDAARVATFRARMAAQRAREEAQSEREVEMASRKAAAQQERDAARVMTFRARMAAQRAREEAQAEKVAERAAAQAAAAQIRDAERVAAFRSRMAHQRAREEAAAERASAAAAAQAARAAAASAAAGAGGRGGSILGAMFGGGDGGAGRFTGGLNTLNNAVGRLRNTFLNARFVVAAFLGALAVGPVIQMVDAMTALDARIGIYASRASDVPYTFEALYQAAQTSRQPLEAIATLYTRLAPLANQLGKSQMDLVRITETVAKAFAISGSTAAEAASSSQQLAQALAANRLGGDELRSLAENAPVLMNEIAKALDKNVGEFIKWAHEGKANAAVVIGAIEEAKTRIDAMFAAMPVTIGQSVTLVTNAMTHLIDRVNLMTGASERIAGFIASFGAFLEAESTINAVANAVNGVMTAFEVMGEVLGVVADLLPAVAAGFASLVVIQTVAASVALLTRLWAQWNLIMAISGTQMTVMQAAMTATTVAARGMLAAVGGVTGILTGGLVAAIAIAVYAYTKLKDSQEAVTRSADMLRSAQENSISAIQRAISFSETYGLSTEKLDAQLQAMGQSSTVAATATDATSQAHARAQTQALARANAERVLTRAILVRAAAESGKAAKEAEDALQGGLFGIGGLEGDANAQEARAQRQRGLALAGRFNADQVRQQEERAAAARQRVVDARRTRDDARRTEREMNALADEFKDPLTIDDITIPNVPGAPTNTATSNSGNGLDGAINRIAKLREEVEGLNNQIKALLANPLDPLADFAARIAAAGDEAAAQYTAGNAAEAGFAAQARELASRKEELQIRLQLLQTMVQEQRQRADEAAQLQAISAARSAANAVMVQFWTSGDRSAEGYATALRQAAAAELEGLKRQEALRIARQYGVNSLDEIAEAYAAATGASAEDALALEDQAKATYRAAAATIENTRAEEDAAAAAAAGINRQQQAADLNAYADALGRGTAALAEYNRQLRIRAAIEENKGLDPVAAARQVDAIIAAEDRVAREERRKAFEEDLRMASMSSEQRLIEAEAMQRVADAIARGSSDAAELNLEAQKTQVAYERAALAVANLKGEIKDDIRQAFAETGRLDFSSLKENLKQRMREAIYDALLAKPIDMVVNAVVNVVTKGLESLLSKITGAADGKGGGDIFGIGDSIKGGMDKFGDQLKGWMDKMPKTFTNALKGIGQFAGQAGAGYSIGSSIADTFGIEGTGNKWQGLLDAGAAVIGNMVGGPIGAAIATIASRLIGSLFSDKKRPLAVTAIEVKDGRFQSRGTQGYDGGPVEEIDKAGREMAALLNKLAKAFDLDLSKAEGLTTLFGWTAGENTKALGGEGFFGGALKELRDMRGMTLDEIKGSALGRGVDLSQVKDAEEAIDRILRETLIRVGEAVGDAFTEAEKAVIRAAESLEEAAATLMAARNVEKNLERALLKFTNPTEYALANLRDQQIERRAGIMDLVSQGLISEDRLPGIEALLQQLERNEIAEALENLANGADGAAASLKQLQEAQAKIAAYVEGLRTGNLSPLSPAAQLGLSRERFEDLLARAQGGDLQALQAITDSSTDFLAAARQFYGSSEAYAQIFESVYSALDALAQQEFEDPLIDVIETQVQRLIDAINAGFGLFHGGDGGDPAVPPVTPPTVTQPPLVGGGGGGVSGGGGSDGTFVDMDTFGRYADNQDRTLGEIRDVLAQVGAAVVASNDQSADKIVDGVSQTSERKVAVAGGKA